jgi:hypothetical protein
MGKSRHRTKVRACPLMILYEIGVEKVATGDNIDY